MEIVTIILIGLYVFVCMMWGIFAAKMQIITYPDKRSRLRLLCVFVGNSMLCPFSILIATVKLL